MNIYGELACKIKLINDLNHFDFNCIFESYQAMLKMRNTKFALLQMSRELNKETEKKAVSNSAIIIEKCKGTEFWNFDSEIRMLDHKLEKIGLDDKERDIVISSVIYEEPLKTIGKRYNVTRQMISLQRQKILIKIKSRLTF